MKKKIIGFVMVAAVAVATGWNVCQGENKLVLSELGLANVEALARGEGSNNGMLNQEYYCRKCAVFITGCFYCTEDPNTCNCTATSHSH